MPRFGRLLRNLVDARPLIDSTRKNPGRSVVVAANNVLVPVLELTGDDELSSVISITLDAELVTALGANQIFRTRAQIQWGVGGVQHEAEVDINRGTIISVPASFLRIAAANEGIGPDVTVFASGTYLPRGGPNRAYRTLPAGTLSGAIAVGATSEITVPPFASTFSIYRAPVGAEYYVQFRQSAGGVNSGEFVLGANVVDEVHPLPNDAQILALTNNGPATTITRVVFGLAF